jgi:hypothetical protein
VRIGDQVRAWICLIAQTSPVDWGITAFSTRSLAKLRDHLLGRETLRRILHAGGVSWQTTTTWKASTDPDFVAKLRRVLALYDHPPRGGRVVCVDEFGPLNLQLRKGKVWRPLHRPRGLRAIYTRPAGVMHMLAALDLATGRLFYRIRPRNAGSCSSTCSRPCEPAGQTEGRTDREALGQVRVGDEGTAIRHEVGQACRDDCLSRLAGCLVAVLADVRDEGPRQRGRRSASAE